MADQRWNPETTDRGWHWLRRRDNLEWRLAFRDRLEAGWRVSDVIGRTVTMSSSKVGRLFMYHGPVRRPRTIEAQRPCIGTSAATLENSGGATPGGPRTLRRDAHQVEGPDGLPPGAVTEADAMKIEVSYDELLDIANALRHRADVFERMPAPLDPAQRDNWKREAENHRALADQLLAQADAAMKAKR